jgi:hypothetical protein
MLIEGNYSETASGPDHFWITYCNKQKEQIYPAFRCKDFMQDVNFAHYLKSDLEIYKFKTDISQKHEYIAISHPQVTININNIEQLIEKVYAITGLPSPILKTFSEYDTESNIGYLRKSTCMFSQKMEINSIFAFLLRVGNFYSDHNQCPIDFIKSIPKLAEKEQYIEAVDVTYSDRIYKFLSNKYLDVRIASLPRLPSLRSAKTDVIHNSTGIMNYYSKHKDELEQNLTTSNICTIKNLQITYCDKNGCIERPVNTCKDFVQAFFYNTFSKSKTKHDYNKIHKKPSQGPFYIVLSSNTLNFNDKGNNILKFFAHKDHCINPKITIKNKHVIMETTKLEKNPALISMFGSFLRISPFYDNSKSLKEFILKLPEIMEKNGAMHPNDYYLLNNNLVFDYFKGIIPETTWGMIDTTHAATYGILAISERIKA